MVLPEGRIVHLSIGISSSNMIHMSGEYSREGTKMQTIDVPDFEDYSGQRKCPAGGNSMTGGGRAPESGRVWLEVVRRDHLRT